MTTKDLFETLQSNPVLTELKDYSFTPDEQTASFDIRKKRTGRPASSLHASTQYDPPNILRVQENTVAAFSLLRSP